MKKIFNNLYSLNEVLSKSERDKLKKELDDLDIIIKKSPFIDPRDMNRRNEIQSLLLSNGESGDYRLSVGKTKKSHRVSPFNRNRT